MSAIGVSTGLSLVQRSSAAVVTPPPAYTPALQFNDARNSQYLALLAA